MSVHHKAAGVFSGSATPYRKHNGVWSIPQEVFVKENGVWKSAWASLRALFPSGSFQSGSALTFTVGNDGQANITSGSTVTNGGGTSLPWTWADGLVPAEYEIMVVPITGSFASGTVNQWLSLGTTRSWVLSASATVNFGIRVRKISDQSIAWDYNSQGAPGQGTSVSLINNGSMSPTVQLFNLEINRVTSTPSVTYNANGTATWVGVDALNETGRPYNWLLSGSASSCQIRATRNSGLVTGSSTNQWIDMGASAISWSVPVQGSSVSLTVEIRNKHTLEIIGQPKSVSLEWEDIPNPDEEPLP
jgi:hypothetical protein